MFNRQQQDNDFIEGIFEEFVDEEDIINNIELQL